jgi:hypothetical protein
MAISSGIARVPVNQAIELLRNTTDAIGDIAIKVVFFKLRAVCQSFPKS